VGESEKSLRALGGPHGRSPPSSPLPSHLQLLEDLEGEQLLPEVVPTLDDDREQAPGGEVAVGGPFPDPPAGKGRGWERERGRWAASRPIRGSGQGRPWETLSWDGGSRREFTCSERPPSPLGQRGQDQPQISRAQRALPLVQAEIWGLDVQLGAGTRMGLLWDKPSSSDVEDAYKYLVKPLKA